MQALQPVLQFVRNHLVTLICGLAAIGFIVIAVLGMTSETVPDAMRKIIQETGAGNIGNLKRNAKNDELIQKKKLEGELFLREYSETVEVAKAVNKREPLMVGVFPTPERPSTPFEFREAYNRALRLLPVRIDAGTLPTQAEINEEQANVIDLLEQEKAKADEAALASAEGGRQPPASVRPGARPPVAPPTPRPGGEMAGREARGGRVVFRGGEGGEAGGYQRYAAGGEGGGYPPAGSPAYAYTPSPGGEPKYDAQYRARVAKAKSIRCYVDEQLPQSFHVSPIAMGGDAPKPLDMWFAQVSLWIQQDVINAIAKLNQQAANAVADGDAFVEHMPVKRIVALRVHGYALPRKSGEEAARGASGAFDYLAGPSGGATALPSAFTNRTCNEQYDVVRFTLQAVVDQRELMKIVDALCRENFYQCLNISYEAANRGAEEQAGYFYGTAPVVHATLDFEGYLLREVYQPLMPTEVKQLLGIEKKKD